MARTCLACASTTSATCGSRILAIANALPVASSTTRSVGAKLRANRSKVSGVVAIRPAERARPPSAIATWQKSRCTSNPIDLPTTTSQLDNTIGECGGQNDTYGFALAAHPGKSQGRPVTPAGSQPIGTEGLPDRVLPEPLSRNAPNLELGSDAPSDSGSILMPVHQPQRRDRGRPERVTHSRYASS